MPLHDGLEHGRQEPAISARLVLGAAGDGVSDITEDPVVADQGGEVGRLQLVDDVDKLGRIDCIPAVENFVYQVMKEWTDTYVKVKIHLGNRQVCRN